LNNPAPPNPPKNVFRKPDKLIFSDMVILKN
jgi:hypothetical protein